MIDDTGEEVFLDYSLEDAILREEEEESVPPPPIPEDWQSKLYDLNLIIKHLDYDSRLKVVRVFNELLDVLFDGVCLKCGDIEEDRYCPCENDE